VTWNTWPSTYLSMDPNAGIPIGADVTYVMDGIVKASEKVTKTEFAARIKKKYPETPIWPTPTW
jgi:hypothetical protein